ncbi:MAG: hypothetical protein A2015_17235 [Spirochaetes bacterium GWF1_31_7]|nr:MAG: hypothetical protein A2Y30_09985 [Spirochaetes bacterium GWE1_32_154]OHD46500.1 MAG: hypothetical protein A2Y29_04115 [Spirochaetes bacterium GWE2_31_10]OHD46733.1 MAG: hypothetical protein A2015_17235 [Spirochaetes bacterium GWF1_31_7]
MIRKANNENIDEIAECLNDSDLYNNYWKDRNLTLKFIKDGISNDELFVFSSEKNNIIGFIRIDFNGMFSNFPLLRVLAVKSGHRNRGIGEKLLKYYQDLCFKNSDKVFLCVTDLNTNAQRFYGRNGFQKVGEFANLYKENINEYLMMKIFEG